MILITKGGSMVTLPKSFTYSEMERYSNELYDIGRAEMLDEVIKTLAKSEETMLSDKQYYTLMELKEQK